ncbi:phosducin, partial [Coemansia nantahalensis]
CIHNYPDKNLPTLLIYGHGDMKGQLVRLDRYGGMRTRRRDIEQYLLDIGAVDKAMRRPLAGDGDSSDGDSDDGRAAYVDLGKRVG